MLAKTNDETLRQYKHVDPEFVFFYQRWKEMLDSRTLEMHQYNLLNSCAACAELAEVVDKTMEGLFTTRQNVEDCRNEAMEIVKTDQILERRNRPLRNMLLRVLSGKIDTKQRGETADDKSGAFYISLNRLKYQLKTPVRQLKEEYLSYVIHDLEEGLWAGDKAQVEMSADSLISQCITMGWSAKGLSELSSCLEGKESARTKWNRFVRKITVDWQERFEVYYSVKIETRAGLSADHIRQTILSLGLELKKGEEILAGAAGAKDFCSKIKAETVYIVTSVYVPDCIRCGSGKHLILTFKRTAGISSACIGSATRLRIRHFARKNLLRFILNRSIRIWHS